MRRMYLCPTANELFHDFAAATAEHAQAGLELTFLTGRHKAFAKAIKVADKKRWKSCAARQILEHHRDQHGCRV
jgi:hypothetical protein